MKGKYVSLEVCVHGKPVREYQHLETTWIEGRKNSEFSLRFRNHTRGRILVVPSIDGLNIIDGKKCSFDSDGYVVRPHETMSIPGWRLDNSEVAKFVFGKKGNAYAAQMGEPLNVGVIGAAVFLEKAYDPKTVIRKASMRDGMKMGSPRSGGRGEGQTVCSTSNAVLDSNITTVCSTSGSEVMMRDVPQDLGTGFGDRSSYATVEVPFDKHSETPDEVMSVRYDSRQNLRKRGINLDPKPVVTGEPNAFPAEERGCKPPAGWEG